MLLLSVWDGILTMAGTLHMLFVGKMISWKPQTVVTNISTNYSTMFPMMFLFNIVIRSPFIMDGRLMSQIKIFGIVL